MELVFFSHATGTPRITPIVLDGDQHKHGDLYGWDIPLNSEIFPTYLDVSWGKGE